MIGFVLPHWRFYDAKKDRKRAWSRELMFRIIKRLGPDSGNEHMHFTPIENEVALFLQQRFPDTCKFNLQPKHTEFDIYSYICS